MKRSGLYILLLLLLLILTACSVKKTDTDKIRDIEFTVMDPQEVPQELKEQMKEAGEEAFWLTYADQGYLYIARGYGRKNTSGYSVEVSQCYETTNAIHMKSTLLGPQKGEKVQQKHTCPYVVIKLEYSDKDVVFD